MPSASSGIFNLLVFQLRMETRVEAGPQPGPTCGSAGETPLEQQGLGLTFYYNTHSHFCLQNIVWGCWLLHSLQCLHSSRVSSLALQCIAFQHNLYTDTTTEMQAVGLGQL